MEEGFNPYAAPKAQTSPEPTDAHAIRLAHLRTESHLRAVGVFLTLGSVVTVLAQVIQIRALEREFGSPIVPWKEAITIVPFLAGIGLWCLQRWAWILAIAFLGVFALINLTELPRSALAVVFQVVLLRFLVLPKTRRVMSEDYPGIMAATPELHSPVAYWGRWAFGILTLLAIFACLTIFLT